MPSPNRVDLILRDRRAYTFENFAAKNVSLCFEKKGISSQTLYLSDGLLHDYLMYIQESPPIWTLSFSHTTQNKQLFCDALSIPHFYWHEGPLLDVVPYLCSNFGKVGISYPRFCEKLYSKNLVYLPHGVERIESQEKRLFDAVAFTDLVELDWLSKSWESHLSSEEIAIIRQGVECKDPFETLSHFFYVERYLNAQKANDCIAAFKQVKLDVFGEHAGNDWLLRLPQTTRLHAKLPFSEHFEVLKMSKIVILDSESPWFFPAVAAGCLPVNPNEEKVRHYLAEPTVREKALEALQEQIFERSWERQTDKLLELMQ